MPRLPRFDVPGYAQHVIQRGNDQKQVFFGHEYYEAYLAALRESAGLHGVAVHAYVLMPNHVHLLVTPRRKGALSRMMQALGRRYVGYVNRRRERSGTLWEGRFRSTVIDGGAYLLTCQRYIEMNPVRAGLVRMAGSYPYSSFRHYVVGEPDALLTPHPVYRALGANPEQRRGAYRALFEAPLDTAIVDEIRHGTNHGWAVGRECFKKEIEVVARRRATPKPRGGRRPGAGRPRKGRHSA